MLWVRVGTCKSWCLEWEFAISMGDRVGSFEKVTLKKNLRERKQVFAGKAWNRARLVHGREGEAECGPSNQGRQHGKESQRPAHGMSPRYAESCGICSGKHRKPAEASGRRVTAPDTDSPRAL